MAPRLVALLLSATLASGSLFLVGGEVQATPPAIPGVVAAAAPHGRVALLDPGTGLVVDEFGHRAPRPALITWAPDGSRLAYVTVIESDLRLVVAEVDGAPRSPLRGVSCPYDVAWSPEGDQLAYTSCNGLRIVGADGSDDRRVLDRDVDGVDWAPNGRRLATAALTKGGDRDIVTVRPDGTGLRHLTDSPAEERGRLSWSPSGKQLAYTHVPQRDHVPARVGIVSSGGGSVERVTPKGLRAQDPSWSPDGLHLAFRNDGIKELTMSSGTIREISSGYLWYPAWQPAWGRIATSRDVVDSGASVELTTDVDLPNGTEVAIQRRYSGATWGTIATVNVDGDGISTVSTTVEQNSWYRLRWSGDLTDGPLVSAPTVVMARLNLATRVRGEYAQRTEWNLFHSGDLAILRTSVSPVKPQDTICFVAERRTPSGVWKFDWRQCTQTTDTGDLAGTRFTAEPAGTHLRVRAAWHPRIQQPHDHEHVSTSTAWSYLKITR